MEYDRNQNYDKYKKHNHIASQELKLETLRLCLVEGEPVEYVSIKIPYLRIMFFYVNLNRNCISLCN